MLSIKIHEKLRQSVKCKVRPLVDATGCIVINEPFIENWSKHLIANAVLYDAISIMQCMNRPHLGIVYLKSIIAPNLIGSIQKRSS